MQKSQSRFSTRPVQIAQGEERQAIQCFTESAEIEEKTAESESAETKAKELLKEKLFQIDQLFFVIPAKYSKILC